MVRWWKALGCFVVAVSAAIVFMALIVFVSLLGG